MLGLEDWQFPRPIFVGDTLHCRLEITELRPTSKGNRAVAGRRFELVDAHDAVVQQGRMPMLVRRRGEQT